jgi:hypothetical protein
VDEGDYVGVLLDRAGLVETGEQRPLVAGALFTALNGGVFRAIRDNYSSTHMK